MQKIFTLMLVTGALASQAWAAPPVDNTVPPCDDAVASKKPSCHMDSDSVNQPPKMPHEHGVIVPPEVPAEGLPNQKQRRQQQHPTEPVPLDPAAPQSGSQLSN